MLHVFRWFVLVLLSWEKESNADSLIQLLSGPAVQLGNRMQIQSAQSDEGDPNRWVQFEANYWTQLTSQSELVLLLFPQQKLWAWHLSCYKTGSSPEFESTLVSVPGGRPLHLSQWQLALRFVKRNQIWQMFVSVLGASKGLGKHLQSLLLYFCLVSVWNCPQTHPHPSIPSHSDCPIVVLFTSCVVEKLLCSKWVLLEALYKYIGSFFTHRHVHLHLILIMTQFIRFLLAVPRLCEWLVF